jgi:hypothetical protein
MLKSFIFENKTNLKKVLDTFTVTEKGGTTKSITEKNKNIYIDILNGATYNSVAKKYGVTTTAISDRVWRTTMRLKKFI